MKVLVVIARGLQSSYVGCYGNEWLATPTLDRLAAEGIVFDQHLADHPDTAGARRSWRAGIHCLPALPAVPLAKESAHDLVKLLRAEKVSTTLIVDGTHPLPADFLADWEQVKRVKSTDATPLEHAMETTQAVLKRLAKRDSWLVWVELATLLPPWQVPPSFQERYFAEDEEGEVEEDETDGEDDEDMDDVEDDEAEIDEEGDETDERTLTPLIDPAPGFVEPAADVTLARLQRSYAGAVAFFDAGLELLLEDLRKRGRLDDMTVIVTSDRGFPLGEHGVVGDFRPWLHDELIHAPLIVRLPGAAHAGQRVGSLTQALDLMPTLLAAFDVPIPPDIHGHDLAPLVRGEVEHVRDYACSGLSIGERIEWALRTPEWSFLLPILQAVEDVPRVPQLFVKPDDCREVNNLLQHNQDLAEHLERVLRGFVAASQVPGRLNPPPLKRLDG
ncbi:MAG: sulfatase-like hydrolase/transferase [Gemmataceae bacterium]|nr:sulfatase-like hydrolase/transferase [Gemmataceae bacterium]